MKLTVKELPFDSPYLTFLRLTSAGYPVKLFLDSALVNRETGRYSVIAVGSVEELSLKNDDRCFEKLKDFYSKLSSEFRIDGLPFGIYGFLTYNASRFVESVPVPEGEDPGFPDIFFFLPETTFIFDNIEKKLTVVSFSNVPSTSKPAHVADFHAEFLGFNMSKDYFVYAVERIKNYIACGDTFQVNFSQRLNFRFKGSSVALFHALRGRNPSPFSFYLNLGELVAVSSSPERLVARRGNTVTARPIAGTRRRGSSSAEDARLWNELILSEKERAEHIMLVDLQRNDLGKVCRYGTVKADRLMFKESYSHVIHIVSSISGELRKGVDSVDILRAMFPGGTITGAPKPRTMEIIAEVEPTSRSLYTGSVGYIGFNDTMDFNIVIRTILLSRELAFVQVGAGVVWDSHPLKEYKETLHKAGALLESLNCKSFR